ncbi:hypothetical protein Syun_024180 [Stephania yunnanensis]|uniref:Uncharacterized protein n=1 Tax=Stephania yunnanensis TaxID=152371 RepID=A0AAP0FBG9_9MAGN
MAAVADAPEVITIAETGQAITELQKLEDGISLAPEIVLSLAKAEESGISQYVSEQVNPVVEDKISTFEGEIFLESPSLTKFVVEETCQASEDSGSQEKPNLKEKETLKSTSTLQDNQTNESIEGENIEASDKEAPVHIEGENIKTKEEKLVTSSETATEEAIESTETTDDCTVGDKVGTFMIDEQVAVDLKEENAEVANTAEFSTQENESAQVTNIHTEGLKIDNSVKEVPLSMIEERVKSSEPLAEEKLDEPVEATNSVTEGDDADTPGKEVLAALPREHTNPEVEKQATALDSLTEEKTHESVEVPDHLQLQEGEGADNSVNEVTENVTGKNVKQEDEHLVKSLDLSSEERADESVEETDDLAEINKVDTSIPADVQREAVDLEGEQPVQSSEIFATEEADGTRSGEVETSGNEVQEGENVNAEDEQKANPTQLITEEKLDEYIEVANRPAEDEKQWENANPQDEKQAKPSESFTEEDNVEEQVQTELLPSSIPSESNIPSREESGSFDINDVVNEKISQNAGEFSEIKQEAAEEHQETSDVIHSDLLKTAEATHNEPTLEGIHASQSLKEEEKAINDFQTDDTEGSKSCMDLNLQISDESPQTVEEPLGPDQEASPPATDHAEPSQERDVVIERESENKEEIIEKTREQETCNDSTFTGQNLDIKDEHIKSDSSEVCLQGELEGTSKEKPFDIAQTMSQDEGVENENPQESHVNSLAITSPDILNGGSDNTENEKKIPVTPGMEETGYHKAETEEGGEMPECTMAHSTAQGSQEITERETNVASSLEDKLHDENIERVEAGDEEDQNQEHSQPREEPLVVKLEGAIDAVTELPETVSLSTHDEAEGNEKEATSSMDQEKSFEEESKEVQTKSGDNIEPEVPKEEVFEADNETTKQIIEDVAAVPISKDIVGEETVKESSKNNEVMSNEVCEGLEVNREREEAEKLMKDGGVNATNNSTLFAKEETTNHSFHDDEMAKNQEEAKEHKETLEIVGGEEVAEEERTQTERDETLSNAPIYIPDVSTEQVEHKETLEIVGVAAAAEEERTLTEKEETVSNASIYIPDVSTEQVEHKETLEIVGEVAAEEEITQTERDETLSNASISIPDVSTEQVERKETLEIVGEVAAEEEITQTERDETLSNASISIPDVSTEQVERKETLEIVGEVAAEEEIRQTERDEMLSDASISIPDVSTEQVEHKETLEIVEGEVAAEEERTLRDETLSNASISIPDVSEQVEHKETLKIVGEVAAEEETTQTERDETLSNASISIPDVSTEQVEHKEILEIVEGEVAAEEVRTLTERDETLSNASISIPDVSEQVEHKETLKIVGEVAAEEETTQTERDEMLSNASISIPDVSTEQVEHKETLEIVEGEVAAEEERTLTERDETLSNASISIPDVSNEQVEHKETLKIVGEVAAEGETAQTERDGTLSNASISIPDVSTEQVEERDLEQDESTTRQISSCISEQEGKANDERKHDVQVPASALEYEVECAKNSEENKAEGEPQEISALPSKEHESKLIEENDQKKCETAMDNDTQGEEVKIPVAEQIMEDASMRKEEPTNLKEANDLLCEDIDGENQNEEFQQTQAHTEEVAVSPDVALNNPYKEVDALVISHTLDDQQTSQGVDEKHGEVSDIEPGKEIQGEDGLHTDVEELQLETAEMEKSTVSANSDDGRTAEEFQQTQAHTEEVAVSPDVALNNPYKEVDALLISHTLDDQRTSQGIDEKHGEVSDIEPGKEIQGEDGLHTDVEELQLETAEMEKSTVSANSDDGRTAEVEISELIQTSQTECMELTNTSKGDFQSEDTHAHDDGKDEERSEEQTTIVDFHQKGIEDEKVEERIIEEDTFLKNHNEESSFESEKEQKIEHDEFQTANASDNVEVIELEINNVQDISTESVEGQTINESTGEDKKEEENPDGEVPGGLTKSETTTDREEEVIEDNCTFKDHDAQCTGEEVDKQMYPEQTRTDNDTEEEEKKEEVKESELSSAKGFRATISTEEKDTGAEDVKDSNDNPSDFNATTEASAETIQREASLKASEASIVVSAQHTDEETSEKAHDANNSSPSASVPSIEEKLSIKDDGQEDEKLVETSPHTYETHSVLEEESGTGSTNVVETEKLEETSDFNEYPTDETTIGGKSDVSEVEVEKFLPGTNATHKEIGATSESEMTDPNEHFNENSDNVRESSKIVSNEQEREEEKILSGAHVEHEETGPTSDSLTTETNEGFTENSENVQETSMPISKEQEQESIAMDMEIKEEAPLASEIQNENLETLLVAQPKEEIKNQVEQQENIPEGEQEVNSTSGEHEKAEKDTPDDIEDHAKSNDNLDEHEEPLMVEKPEISTELVAEDQGQAKLSIAKEVGEVAAEGGTSSIDDQMASQTLQNKGTEGENLDEAQRELAFEDRMINDTNQPTENETLVSEAIEKRSDIEMVDKHIIDEEKIPLKQVHEADIAPERNFETSESIEQNEIDTPGETHLEETRDALPVAEVSEQEVKERDCAELTEAYNFSEGKEIFREGEDNAHKLDTESLTITTEKIESPEVVTEVQTILEASAMDFEEKRVEMLETNETEINVEKGTNLEITSVSHLPDEKADQKITDEKPDNYSIGSVAETQKDAQEKDEEIENKEIHEEDRRADEPNVDDENSKEEMVEAVNFDEDIETKDTEKQEIVPNEASVSNTLVEEVSERETESKCEEALYAPSEEPAKDLEYESQQLRITDINTEENGNKENEGIVPQNETAIPCASGNSEDKKTDEQPEEAEPRVDAEEHQIEEIRKDNEGIQEETSTAEVSDELQTNATIENTTQEVSEVEEIVAQPCLTFSEERVNECDEEEKEQREKAHGETAKTEPEDQTNEKAIDENQIEKTREATDPISYEEVQTELDITHTNDAIEQITGDEGLTRDTTLVTVEGEKIQEKHQELEKNEEMIEMASGELKPEEPKTILESEKDQDMKTDLTQVEVIMNREIVEVSEEKEKADIHEEIDRSFAEEKEALEDLYQVRSV